MLSWFLTGVVFVFLCAAIWELSKAQRRVAELEAERDAAAGMMAEATASDFEAARRVLLFVQRANTMGPVELACSVGSVAKQDGGTTIVQDGALVAVYVDGAPGGRPWVGCASAPVKPKGGGPCSGS